MFCYCISHQLVPFFTEYSVHFYKLKMMVKYFLQKVAEKGFKMAFMMNKLAMINSCEIILEEKKKSPKIIVKFRCALYSYLHYTR